MSESEQITKKILEFMGFELREDVAQGYYINPKTKAAMLLPRDEKYLCSYDWLELVLSKIHKLKHSINVNMVWGKKKPAFMCEITSVHYPMNYYIGISGKHKYISIMRAIEEFLKPRK